MSRIVLLLWIRLVSLPAYSQELRPVDTHTDASFRGLSVVNDSVAWVSGTKGWIGRSIHGGQAWSFTQVKGFEKADFRTLYAFGYGTAIIANAGSPASILYTHDGGSSWDETYINTDSSAFFDGIGFWNEQDGIIYGDPVRGKMLMLRTHDGGRSWKEPKSSPALAEGEASFAASGTTIRCLGERTVVIATGGKVSRLWISRDRGDHWDTIPTPILQGLKSTGIFSLACLDEKNLVITGGDYLRDTFAQDHVFYSIDGGRNWSRPSPATRGYRECVEYITPATLIATGPRGTDISKDGGRSWQALSEEQSFHAVRKARKGSLVIMTGGKGKISVLKTVNSNR